MEAEKELFQGRYRTDSMRLKGWDYTSNGMYFITICTQEKETYFGDMKDQKVILNELGNAASENLAAIPDHFADTKMLEYVVMPDHIHGIIELGQNGRDNVGRDATCRVSTQCPSRSFGPLQPGSISKMVQAYKSSVTRWARKNGFKYFAWQPGYYDHIIRKDTDLERIRDYILLNPERWDPLEKDRNA